VLPSGHLQLPVRPSGTDSVALLEEAEDDDAIPATPGYAENHLRGGDHEAPSDGADAMLETLERILRAIEDGKPGKATQMMT